MPRIHDISIPIVHAGVTYPGNPAIAITPHQAIRDGAGANVSTISFGSHTSTHVDAPRHFIEDGDPVDRLPLDRLIGPARVFDIPDDVLAIGRVELDRLPLGGVTRALFKTRNSRHLLARPDFARDYTYLAPDAAERLVELGVTLVGVDYYSVEQFRSGHHRTHRTLLSRGVVIVEGLRLTDVPAGDYDLVCLPLLLAGLDGAPARAVLIER